MQLVARFQPVFSFIHIGNIAGNKMNNVGIVYTLWENLKKTSDMDVGQIGFHKQKEVQYCFS